MLTLSEARSRAAAAIREAAGDLEITRVVESDVITPRMFVQEAAGLIGAAAQTAGSSGPAVVAVMAVGRKADQSIVMTALTLVRNLPVMELDLAGRGRGLAVLDHVEDALSTLPPHGLPSLLVETRVEELAVRVTETDSTVHVFSSTIEWPPAEPGEPDGQPLATARGSALGAIREHFGMAVEHGLGLVTAGQLAADGSLQGRYDADQARRGETMVQYRQALRAGYVPRARISLETYREAYGGPPDSSVRPQQTWDDDQGRRWHARVMSQKIVGKVEVWHRTEALADEAILAVSGWIDDRVVVWPGDFDALVLVGDDLEVQRLTGGTYQQQVHPLQRDPAIWDDAAGLALSSVQWTVDAISPLEPARQAIRPRSIDAEASFRIPATAP